MMYCKQLLCYLGCSDSSKCCVNLDKLVSNKCYVNLDYVLQTIAVLSSMYCFRQIFCFWIMCFSKTFVFILCSDFG
jgi:hypothetical protein